LNMSWSQIKIALNCGIILTCQSWRMASESLFRKFKNTTVMRQKKCRENMR
jgi:hypothetical protein